MLRKLLLCLVLASASMYAGQESAQTTQVEVSEDPWSNPSEFDGVINQLHDNGAFQQHKPKHYAWWQVKLMRVGANIYLYYHLCTKKIAALFGYAKSKKKAKKPACPTTPSPVKPHE